ncbi:hypothetical protein DXT99_23660 [Pontibacter diazotrophicus]|uniref:STAS/SEC14 domain-containing protein n=1 Tax=Pontibacter diazotrophicus TaxID=1400979 RepID=A0A3D8L3B6_9BACT|nr:hypothetical protein [Pontibacter diazotrophicus]RDV11904.1 hypothetical protein DXT99_23660 [Pontibacter diazotrophicus]
MLIYSGIINLNYDPVSDVLVTSMPDVRQFGMSEVSFCLGLIVDNIRNYDIKKLLLDSSESMIEVENEAYKAIVLQFGMDLMKTRLKRIARVATTNATREESSAKLSGEIRQELNLPIEFKNFIDKTEAMDWLLEKV